MTGPRACTPSELPQLACLADAVFRAQGGSMQAEYPLVFGEENLNFCRVIEEDGRIVSHVSRSASFLPGAASELPPWAQSAPMPRTVARDTPASSCRMRARWPWARGRR